MADLAMASSLQARPEYGDACSEVLCVHRAVGVAPVSQTVLTLTGEDRGSFIHNISSNDIKSLKPGQGCESLILTPKGKIQFPIAVLAGQDRLDILVDDSLAAPLKIFLESSLIMEDVSIKDEGHSHAFFHLAGPKLNDLMTATALVFPPETELSWVEADEIVTIRRHRSLETGVDVRVPAGAADDWFQKFLNAAHPLGGGPVGAIAQDILRIEASIPKFGADYTTDHFPQEAALEGRAVSFTKGCYTGQEVVARIKTYGGVNRRLVGLVIEGAPAAPGDKLFKDQEESGRVTSAARSLKFSKSVALAMLSKNVSSAGNILHVASPDGSIATVTDIAGRR